MHPRDAQHGFTLVEIMVVIGIIAILVGIGIAVGPAVLAKGEEQRTKALLRACEGVLEEYKAKTGTVVNNVGDYPRNWWGTAYYVGNQATVQIRSIQQFFVATSEIPSIRDGIWANYGESVINDNAITDGWGTRLIYCASTEVTVSGAAVNWFDFLPSHDQPFFASAGVDGQWGDASAAVGSVDHDASLDNLYSYDVGD